MGTHLDDGAYLGCYRDVTSFDEVSALIRVVW